MEEGVFWRHSQSIDGQRTSRICCSGPRGVYCLDFSSAIPLNLSTECLRMDMDVREVRFANTVKYPTEVE